MLLNELRSHPEQNVKQSPLAQLESIAKQHGTKGMFVTFTLHKKFGTNPKSTFATPLGLYAYPLQYVIDMEMKVPYADKCPHIWVFQTSEYWDLRGDVNGVFQQKLVQYFEQNDLDVDLDLLRAKNNSSLYKGIKKSLELNGYYDNKKNPNIILRQILVNIGALGVLDMGTGSIHKNEPTQAVFFDVSKLKVVSYIYNNTSVPETIPDKNIQVPQKSFNEYYDYIVNQKGKRDVNVERNIKFTEPPSDDMVRKFIVKSIFQRGGRIQFLEGYIAQSVENSLNYARDVLQKRFLRGEKVLKQNPNVWKTYTRAFPELQYLK